MARASVKLEEFRQKIKALFEKTRKGEKVINQDDQARVREIFAIAEADAVRVQDEGRSLDTILGEAQAGLARSAVSEDLGRTLDGLKESRQKLIEKALAEYREALVEVLKEGENPAIKEETGSITVSGVAANPDAPVISTISKEQRPARSGKQGKSEPWIDDFISSISRDFKDDEALTAEILTWEKPKTHVAEYKKLVAMAMEADYQRKEFSAANAEYYEKLMADIKAASKEYIALQEAPQSEAAPLAEVSPGEEERAKADDIAAAVAEATTESNPPEAKNNFFAQAQAEIAARQQVRLAEEVAAAQRVAALRESKQEAQQKEVTKLTNVIDQIRRFEINRAEENIRRLTRSAVSTDVALADVWKKMKSEGLEIQTARLLQGYLQGRIDKRFIQDDYLPVKQQIEQPVQAGVSIFSKDSVLEVAKAYGFDSEEAILVRASAALPSEKEGSSKGFGSASAETKRDEGKRVRLKQIESRLGEIQRLLDLYKGTPAEKSEGAQKLIEEKSELQDEQAGLQAELGPTGSSSERVPASAAGSVKETAHEVLTPLQESLRDNEDRLRVFKKAIADWKDTTEIDGVIGGWVTWLEGVIEVQKALAEATASEDRVKYVSALESVIAACPSADEVKKIQDWFKAQRSGRTQEYIAAIVEPRADAFALVSGFKAQKLTELLKREKSTGAASAREASDDPVVEIIDGEAVDDDNDQVDVISANEPPVAPEVIPPTPEAAETAIDRAELAARTEAARGMLGSIHANIATWSRGRESVGKEYYIKDAIAHIEAVVRVDEDFLMIPSPTPEDERVYKEKRDALVKGEGLAREYNRLFSLLPGQKMIYVNELDGWIKSTQGRIKDAEKRKDQAAQKSEEQRLSELQKRKEVIDAIAPFFEVWLKMETKEAAAPVTEVSTAPKPPEATTAPADTTPPAPPEAAPAVPPAPDAAPVPPVVPPFSPDVIPPAPPSPDKADTTPEPGFANEALFSVADRTKILAWINAQRPRVDRAKKMAADKDLQEAQKRYKPFAHNLKWLDSILEATSQLTQAATMQERMNREMVLMRLKEEILVPGAEAALSEIKAERRQLKGDAQHFEDNTPYSSQFQRSKSEIKARLKQVDEEIELMEMNVELERALMEVVIVKTTNEDPGKFKKEIADGEARLEQKDISWKEVVDAASQAQEDLRARMETRKQNTEAEPYFGAVFQAFLKEQEATVGLNKALRRFDILDKTELQVTQALRLLDVAPNGPITSAIWNELPSSAKMVLKRAGEGESSTGENIKARLYEVLRGLTNDKVEADKVLQEQLKMVDGLKEQSAYVLAQKTYKKLLTDQRSIAQEIRRLTSDVQAYNPLKVTKMADKTFYVEKLREVNGRLEIAKNQQRYIDALLKDGEALLGISGRTLWGQYQKSGRESTDQAGAFEALQNQAEVTKLIEQVLEGQEQLARFRQVEATREDEIRKTLPAATVQGGGSSFRRGAPAAQNRTSGGGGERPKSVWESFKETGLYKGAAQFVEALSFWK